MKKKNRFIVALYFPRNGNSGGLRRNPKRFTGENERKIQRKKL